MPNEKAPSAVGAAQASNWRAATNGPLAFIPTALPAPFHILTIKKLKRSSVRRAG